MFVNSLRNSKAEGVAVWKARMMGMLRQTPNTTITQVYDDFIAEFRAKNGTGSSHNTREGKPTWKDGKPLCFKCGEYGHKAADCPKRDEGGGNGSSANFADEAIPIELRDIYESSTYEA